MTYHPAHQPLLQAWVQAVRANATVLILSSGRLEYVCVRHRESQTLYISPLIRPYMCPKWGKLQVGLYIAAIEDAVYRYKLNKDEEARDKSMQWEDRGEGGSGDGEFQGRVDANDGARRRQHDHDVTGGPTPKRRRVEPSAKVGKLGNSKKGRSTNRATVTRRMTRGTAERERHKMEVRSLSSFLRSTHAHARCSAASCRQAAAVLCVSIFAMESITHPSPLHSREILLPSFLRTWSPLVQCRPKKPK